MANTRKFSPGMFIIMPQDLTYTNKTCGASPTMYAMAGKRLPIKAVLDQGKIKIESFIWDERDFKISSPPKKIPISYFDPDELIT